ncbi:hypothetical protein QYE76_007218 [Lolium multiflorum]|uniref:RNA helicase n=1 Tax=Lolium multiflorum TaxID=4521 RepID=A0AAD8RX88_LOLMU|nr:hypothetical protein QYE76_007218 [Lolium multiflorum]
MDPNGKVDSTLVFTKEMLDEVYQKVSPYVVAILFKPVSTGFIAKTNSKHNMIAMNQKLLGYEPNKNKIIVRYSDGMTATIDRVERFPGSDIAILYSPHHGKPRPAVDFGKLEDKECQKIVTIFPFSNDFLFFKGHITLTDCTSESRSGIINPKSQNTFMLTCPLSVSYELDQQIKRLERAEFLRMIQGAAVFDLSGKVLGMIEACGNAHTIKYARKCSAFSTHFDSLGPMGCQEEREKKKKNRKANDMSSSNKERELVPVLKKAKKKMGNNKADEKKMKAGTSVRHLALPCDRAAWAQTIRRVIQCHSHGGQTVIFTETKESASELSDFIPGSRSLDGHSTHVQREAVAGFRSRKFSVLVATNVAAQGLDINDVQLIIQCEPPRDAEDYIERSGWLGKAGNAGVAVMLLKPGDELTVATIEEEFGLKFEHISDVVQSAGKEAAYAIASVSDSVLPVFRKQAEALFSSSGISKVDLLAKALAKEAGYIVEEKRSLLSSMENYTTLHLRTVRLMGTAGSALSVLRRFIPESKLSDVQGMVLTADGAGAIFDVPSEEVQSYIQGAENAAGVTLDEVKQLPALQEREQSRVNSSSSRFDNEAADAIASVPDSVIPVFQQQAEELLSSSSLSAVDLLAKALAKAVGYTDIKKRSLLSSMENCTTLHLTAGSTMYTPSFMPEDRLSNVQGVALTADGRGAVFDVPSVEVQDYLQGADNAAMVTLDEVKQLPALHESEHSRSNYAGSRFGNEVADAIASVSDSVIPVFRQQAEELLSSSSMSAVDLLAKALAKAVGYKDIKKRSLLCSMENCTTLHLTTGSRMYTLSYVRSTLKRFMPEDRLSNVQGVALTADGRGAVFNVPSAEVQDYLQGAENAVGVTLDEVKELPALQEREQQSRGGRGGGRRFGGGGGGRVGFGRRGRGSRGRFGRR